MGVGLNRPKIVDPDHFDIPTAGFGDGSQHVATDTAESVDRDPEYHSTSPQRLKNFTVADVLAE
jgi:hypothetical protein